MQLVDVNIARAIGVELAEDGDELRASGGDMRHGLPRVQNPDDDVADCVLGCCPTRHLRCAPRRSPHSKRRAQHAPRCFREIDGRRRL